MAQRSFFGEMFRKAIFSFTKTLFIGIGIIAIFIGISFLLHTPEKMHYATPVVQPNHTWTQKPLNSKVPTIVEVAINGPIGLSELTHEDVRNQLLATIEDEISIDQVKALLLRIDSPGGTVTDSDGIYNLIKRYKEKYNMPVWAFIDGFCASGAMYIACAADKVFATNASIIGSVGVIVGPIFNFADLMEGVGVKAKTITAGKSKDELNPFRPWKKDEGVIIQTITDAHYENFINIVSSNRARLSKEFLLEHGAHIYPADKALEHGYIDVINNSRDDVLYELVTSLNIESDYQVVMMDTKNWVKTIFNNQNALFSGKIQHTVDMGNCPSKFRGQFLYLYSPEMK